MFNIISKELNVNGKVCDTLEKYFEFLNKFEKQKVKKIDSKKMIVKILIKKKKTDYKNKKLNMLPIQKELSKLKSNKTQMYFDATSINRNWICF